jgi:hypothetical protein
VCTGTLVHIMRKQSGGDEQGMSGHAREEDSASVSGYIGTIRAKKFRERVAMPGRRMRRVCAGTPVRYKRIYSGNEWRSPAEDGPALLHDVTQVGAQKAQRRYLGCKVQGLGFMD